MVTDPIWTLEQGDGPVVATAIHDGHALRADVAALTALRDEERLREEDPWTREWTVLGDTRIVVTRSRFEVDLNRARDAAVYRRPEDAWGLDLWRSPPSADLVARSLDAYDAFYAMLGSLIRRRVAAYGRVLVLDLHSYNHRRGGPHADPEDPAGNPTVNVGTGTLDRSHWAPVVDAFLDAARRHEFAGEPLDVRENVRFRGGNLSRWLNQTWPREVCSLAVEAKKVFMDEWTGRADPDAIRRLGDAFRSGLNAAREAL